MKIYTDDEAIDYIVVMQSDHVSSQVDKSHYSLSLTIPSDTTSPLSIPLPLSLPFISPLISLPLSISMTFNMLFVLLRVNSKRQIRSFSKINYYYLPARQHIRYNTEGRDQPTPLNKSTHHRTCFGTKEIDKLYWKRGAGKHYKKGERKLCLCQSKRWDRAQALLHYLHNCPTYSLHSHYHNTWGKEAKIQ